MSASRWLRMWSLRSVLSLAFVTVCCGRIAAEIPHKSKAAERVPVNEWGDPAADTVPAAESKKATVKAPTKVKIATPIPTKKTPTPKGKAFDPDAFLRERGPDIFDEISATNKASDPTAQLDSNEFRALQLKAEGGDAKTQYELGLRYAWGKEVGKNDAEAAKWWGRAAAQDYLPAKFNLGQACLFGFGVPKDTIRAAALLKVAAEEGFWVPAYYLGSLYATGDGVPKDLIEGLAWYTLAAASGDEKPKKNRDNLERYLGREATLIAQQRSKVLLKEIDETKQRRATLSGGKPSSAPPTGPGAAFVAKASGTGAFLTRGGVLVTAAHVIQDASLIEVATAGGVVPAKVLLTDPVNDLALLKCEGNFEAMPLAPSRAAKLGQAVFTIGFPNVDVQGFDAKATRGEINGLNGLRDDPRQWQISVPVQPGNSGGPLLDLRGRLLGIVVAKLNALVIAGATGDVPQNVNYAIKGAYLRPLLEQAGIDDTKPQDDSSPLPSFEEAIERARKSIVRVIAY